MSFEQIDERLFGIFGDAGWQFFFTITADADDIEDEQTVIGGYGAAALRNDVGMRDLALVANALDVIDDVASVFFESIVDARFEISLRAVVVYAQAAAYIKEGKAGAHFAEVDINAGGFDDGGFDLADIGDLAAEMEVEQLEGIFHAAFFEILNGFEGFADGKAEFGAVAAGGFPAAGATTGEFDANTDGGFDADAFGVFDDEFELGVFFDNGCDLAADFFGQHDHFNVFVVFEAVADDRRFVIGNGENGEEFGLGARFQTKLVSAAIAKDFLDNLALLIDFDGINATV